MKRLALVIVVAAGCAKQQVRETGPNVRAECMTVKGKMPPPTPGNAEARGVLLVAPAVVGRTIYVGIDYTNQDGSRQTMSVGALTPKVEETRFRCVSPEPPDTAFWKFVFVAEPQDECGYFAELAQSFEMEVEVKCKPEFKQTWETYRESLRIEGGSAPTEGPGPQTEEGVPVPGAP